jgi:acyl-CoA reductase-like NAD-dependent aldehyde dehydrogenase
MPFSDIKAVISAANSTSTGLSASVWGDDAKATQRIADSLDVGTVFVNGPSRPDPRVPFSGHKESGIGVEYGLMGLIEYCQVKSVVKYRASS